MAINLEGRAVTNPGEILRRLTSSSPTLLLRISDGSYHIHRAFNDFNQALHSAEAFAGAGFSVSMISATGRFLMGFDARTYERATT